MLGDAQPDDTGNAVDSNRLRLLYDNDDAARALLEHFANRKNDSRLTTVENLQRVGTRTGIELSRQQVISVLQSLESAGCGDFIVGRRGKSSRFIWKVSTAAVGDLARGAQVHRSELSRPTESVFSGEEGDIVVHQYHLRPGLKPVRLELPIDLTVTEAARLAMFITTLPLDQESSGIQAARPLIERG